MRLNVLLSPDSYKGSGTSVEIAQAMAEGLSRAWHEATFEMVPVSDGGDGFVDAMVLSCGGRFQQAWVRGPVGKPVLARYGILADGTAVVEMAQASGLRLVSPVELDPLRASTYGTGELLKRVIDGGSERVIIGVGGSATNDGGAGMAEALGVSFLDDSGERLSGCPQDLSRLARVDASALHPAIKMGKVSITVACDVDSVLCGESGAAHVFGPQKGATPEAVELLDSIMCRYADVVEDACGRKLREVPGSGAAGGLAFGLMAFLNASMRPGFEIVSEAARLDEKMDRAHIVFTGEGRTDEQTKHGKTVSGVIRTASAHCVPVVVLSGGLGDGGNDLFGRDGRVAVSSITAGPATLEECMANAVSMVRDAAYRTARVLDIGAMLASRDSQPQVNAHSTR